MSHRSLKPLSLMLLVTAATLHSVGWLLTGNWWGTLLSLALAALWAAWLTLGNARPPGALPYLATALLLSGAGALWQAQSGLVWVYLGGLATLATWQVGELDALLRQYAPYLAHETVLINGRLRQLALFVTLSLVGLLAWALIPPTLSFERVLVLTLLLLWALAYLLRQRGEIRG